MNPFENIITSAHKEIFNQAIDSLLSQSGLTTPCTLFYRSQPSNQEMLCNNCLFDTITKLSSNIYNGTGPVPFQNNAVCPVCLGSGYTNQATKDEIHEETLYLGVISDSKYFVNLATKNINLADGNIQTYCSINYLSKIKNASYMIMDTSIKPYGNYSYERAGDPDPAGFGDNNYIITMWKRK